MCHKSLPTLTAAQIHKFHTLYNHTETCWLWNHSTNHLGYGFFFVRGQTFLAHRISFFIHNDIDPEKSKVLHSCDTPGCVNPHHLFLGTQKTNAEDRDHKNRSSNSIVYQKGSERKAAKLTEEIVRDIRSRPPYWGSVSALAKEFGVNKTTISKVLRGKKWSHI